MRNLSTKGPYERIRKFFDGDRPWKSDRITRKAIFSSDYHKSLTPEEISDGVVVFLETCKMHTGSADGVDLYDLLITYLRVPESRHAINEVVTRFSQKPKV